MIPRVLSIAGPLWVYASLGVLIYGLWNQRQKFDWLALVPALAGLAASTVFLSPVHRLFFDEDIYINIASNLAHAPVNQVTVIGGPDDIQVSSYYKEPAGWPVFLGLVFLVTGRSEAVAFWTARILFAIAIAAVYQLARQVLGSRNQALVAAILFGATPICFWFSASPGTDIPAALMAILGMWGLSAGNGALAAAGLALAAQTRMELLILLPLMLIPHVVGDSGTEEKWGLTPPAKQDSSMSFESRFVRRVRPFFSSVPKSPATWSFVAAILVIPEIVHVAWVMSVAPVLARAER